MGNRDSGIATAVGCGLDVDRFLSDGRSRWDGGASVRFPRAVLFDLDGTLLDSAPDMLATVNAMLSERGLPCITLAQLRPVVSKGSRAMLAVAFAHLDAAAREALVPEFLKRYEALLGTQAQLFDGVEVMLQRLEQAGIEVVPIAGSELGSGRGGPRCMSCPVSRDSLRS